MGTDSIKEIKDCCVHIGNTLDCFSQFKMVYECKECSAKTTFPEYDCANCKAIKKHLREESIEFDVKDDYEVDAW